MWGMLRRFARAVVFCGALGCALATLGCRDPKVALREGPREYTAQDYPEVFKHWTRTGQLLSLAELDDLLTVSATFESWDFRWAYVVRYAEDYRLTIEQRRSVMDRTLAETKERHRFYVALYGASSARKALDLSKPNSSWIVRLIDDQGNETAPSEIEPIPKPGALERQYFPYTTGFRNVFRISFPRATPDGRTTISGNARWFGLRFAGAEGNQELRWELDADAVGVALARPAAP